jgi:site-specific DNA-methyltransferase (adenine-specific)
MMPYYDDGTCAIYHGDCREVLSELQELVGLVIADPPYGIRSDTNSAARRGMRIAVGTHWPPVAGDDQPFDPTSLLRFPRLVLWGANHYADRLPPSPTWLVWDKVGDLPRKRAVGFNDSADCEMAWTNLGGPARLFRHQWMGYFRASEARDRFHPTQKPVSLMRWIIGRWSQPGDMILEPYMGSGPVLRAAKDLGRRAIGIEIEERYCEIAAKRLGQEVLAL